MQLEVLKLQGSEAPLQPTSPIDCSRLLTRMSKKTRDNVRNLSAKKGVSHENLHGIQMVLGSRIGILSIVVGKDPSYLIIKAPIWLLWLQRNINLINTIPFSTHYDVEEDEKILFEIVYDLNIFLEHTNQHLEKVNGRWFQGAYKFELKDGPAPHPLINMREPPKNKNIPLISAIVISSSFFLAAKYLISSKRKTTIKK